MLLKVETDEVIPTLEFVGRKEKNILLIYLLLFKFILKIKTIILNKLTNMAKGIGRVDVQKVGSDPFVIIINSFLSIFEK